MSPTAEFVATLIAAAPEDLYGLIWTKEGDKKRTRWFQVGDGAEAIANLATSVAATSDTWIAVSAAESAGGPYDRITNERSAGIFGLWADLDLFNDDPTKGPVSKKPYPPDAAAIDEILLACGIPPTMVIHSGNGLQAWWAFDEFWLFEKDADRYAAQKLAMDWQSTLRARAGQQGWSIDTTHDLARVMRLPGTLNHKTDPPKETRLLANESDRRYGPEHWDNFLLDEMAIRNLNIPTARTYKPGAIEIDPDVKVDPALLQMMRDSIDKFAESYDRRRPEFKDQSASSYDLSLASLCAKCGWSDQAIVDLLVSVRVIHGDDLKRPDYYTRTLTRARDKLGQENALDEIEDVRYELEKAQESGDPEKEKEATQAALGTSSNLFELEFNEWRRWKREVPTYSVQIGSTWVHLGEIENLTSQAKFANLILTSDIGKQIPKIDKAAYSDFVGMSRSACVTVDVGPEGTQEGAMAEWLLDFLEDRPPIDDVDEAGESLSPHYEPSTGRVRIFLEPFRTWLRTGRGEKMSTPELGQVLRRIGAEPVRKNFTIRGKRTTRSCWVLPPLSSRLSED